MPRCVLRGTHTLPIYTQYGSQSLIGLLIYRSWPHFVIAPHFTVCSLSRFVAVFHELRTRKEQGGSPQPSSSATLNVSACSRDARKRRGPGALNTSGRMGQRQSETFRHTRPSRVGASRSSRRSALLCKFCRRLRARSCSSVSARGLLERKRTRTLGWGRAEDVHGHMEKAVSRTCDRYCTASR